MQKRKYFTLVCVKCCTRQAAYSLLLRSYQRIFAPSKHSKKTGTTKVLLCFKGTNTELRHPCISTMQPGEKKKRKEKIYIVMVLTSSEKDFAMCVYVCCRGIL